MTDLLGASGAVRANVSTAFAFAFAGETLRDLRLHDVTLGQPHRDARGHVDNAVSILDGTAGDAHRCRRKLHRIRISWSTSNRVRPASSAPLVAIGSADDQIDPPELPITPQTRGHGTHTLPTI